MWCDLNMRAGKAGRKYGLRLREQSWFNREKWDVEYGYEILISNGVLFLRRVGERFEGPSHLLPLLDSNDDRDTVLMKLQNWVDAHPHEVALGLTKKRCSPAPDSLQGDEG